MSIRWLSLSNPWRGSFSKLAVNNQNTLWSSSYAAPYVKISSCFAMILFLVLIPLMYVVLQGQQPRRRFAPVCRSQMTLGLAGMVSYRSGHTSLVLSLFDAVPSNVPVGHDHKWLSSLHPLVLCCYFWVKYFVEPVTETGSKDRQGRQQVARKTATQTLYVANCTVDYPQNFQQILLCILYVWQRAILDRFGYKTKENVSLHKFGTCTSPKNR